MGKVLQSVSEWVEAVTDLSLLPHSRMHPLSSIPVHIKREDESSSGISGGKLRKYASLLPALKRAGVTEVGIIGGSNSNNVCGILQLLREWHIEPWLFLRQAANDQLQGNRLFIGMLCPEERIRWVDRADWSGVGSIAEAFLAKRRQQGSIPFLIPEGGLCQEALAGSITLARDVLRNEAESGHFFEQLFIDSGTGMSAIGLIIGLSLFDSAPERRRIVVTLIAGNQGEFMENLERFEKYLQEKFAIEALNRPPLEFNYPPTCRSFGAVNATLFRHTVAIARQEGILMDPVYSVKHYMSMCSHLADNSDSGLSLFIFNGSALGLAGFQQALSNYIPVCGGTPIEA